MKPALVAAVVLTLGIYLAPGSHAQQKAAHHETEAQNQLSAPSGQVHASTNTETSYNESPHWYQSPEWILVIVAGITAFVVGWQSFETHRTVNATEKSIAANFRQFAAGNRPYVMLPSGDERTKIGDPYIVPAASVPLSEQRRAHCMLYLRNYGKSPARIFAEKFELQIGSSAETVPDEGVFDMLDCISDNFVLAPADSSACEAELTPNPFISPKQKKDIDDGRAFLWLCGFVKYRDTFRVEKATDDMPPEYETRFCLLWETRLNSPQPFWRLAGPKKYNNAD